MDNPVGSGLTSRTSEAGSAPVSTPPSGTASAVKAGGKAGEKAPSSGVATSAGGYRIGPQDVLEISVFKVPELSKSVQVAEAGTINLPLVKEVRAAGKTPRALEQELTSLLGAKFLQNPQVTVYVKEYNSKSVTLEGRFKKPGVYPLRQKTTLLQMVATAQGVTELSDSTIVVFRAKGGKRSAARFDIDDIRSGKSEDPLIRSGDVIVAGTSAIKNTLGTISKILPVARLFTLL